MECAARGGELHLRAWLQTEQVESEPTSHADINKHILNMPHQLPKKLQLLRGNRLAGVARKRLFQMHS